MVKVEEPSEEAAIRMVRGVAGVLEKHHKVEILDEAIEAAVRLSHRYIPARQLPDKAISLLDTVLRPRGRVAARHARPRLKTSNAACNRWRWKQRIIDREGAIGIDVADRKAEVEGALAHGPRRS